MRRLLPEPAGQIDPYDAYADVPPVRVGMVLSADGSVTDPEGWTDGLGGDADFRVFRTLRALTDAILVGAATVRTGRLGPARLRPDLRERRGGPPAPVVVASRSLDLPWDLPLFTAAETPTIVVTPSEGDVPPEIRVVRAPDLRSAVEELRDGLGLRRVLCEGGPGLTTALLRENLVDEMCLNVAPTLLGSRFHTRLLTGLDAPVDLDLASVHEDEGVLFLRYRVGYPVR
ncbi:dihydrofolate reductase family protein [Actinomadura harenae]|uniref:Deaminase n=1 Tax=Actinomadura harenae TaxID=2483351 RepID=A0A3M2LQZ5_9ACTN|nr:dihydrofolate reductase family protein [Actinomadura harenae]RMI39506.1 deaminase [Actinomadura harenae]